MGYEQLLFCILVVSTKFETTQVTHYFVINICLSVDFIVSESEQTTHTRSVAEVSAILNKCPGNPTNPLFDLKASPIQTSDCNTVRGLYFYLHRKHIYHKYIHTFIDYIYIALFWSYWPLKALCSTITCMQIIYHVQKKRWDSWPWNYQNILNSRSIY